MPVNGRRAHASSDATARAHYAEPIGWELASGSLSRTPMPQLGPKPARCALCRTRARASGGCFGHAGDEQAALTTRAIVELASPRCTGRSPPYLWPRG